MWSSPLYNYIYIYMYVCVYICVDVHTLYIYMYIHYIYIIYVYIYVHTHYIYIYVYIYMIFFIYMHCICSYSYTVKRRAPCGDVHWRCTVRSTSKKCLATVRQTGEEFTSGCQTHCHPAAACAAESARISRKTKTTALEHPYMSAFTIAERVLEGKCNKYYIILLYYCV